MREITTIVIHCADTPPGMDIGAHEIDLWHRQRGWASIGYHHVIRRDGTVEDGRSHSEVGAHVAGHNATSIGVCMVGGKGGCNFTRQQWRALDTLVDCLTTLYPRAAVCGHRDMANGKACPTFDARAWWNYS